jgi:DNA-binding transcriptional LysR family regulator
MRSDLTDLRLFVNVHDAGTITGGAAATHMTLASASERIRSMEESLGVPLLLRERRGVRPTPAGRTLLHHARLVLRQMDRLQGELGEYGTGLKGHIRLLCNTSAFSEHLPELLSGFLRMNPGVSIDLEERPSYEIVDALRTGVCEIGIVSDAVDLEGLQTFAFRADPLVLVVPKGHPLTARTAVALADVADYSFVGLVQGSALQEHISHHARRLGKQLNYRIRLRSFESVCRVVGQDIGVGIVPSAVAVRCARTTQVKRLTLTDSWAARRLVLCTRRGDELPLHAQQLLRHVLGSGSDSGQSRRQMN